MFNLKNLLLIGIASHAVLLVSHFGVLLSSDSKILFPLLALGAWAVISRRKPEIQELLDEPSGKSARFSRLDFLGFLVVVAVGFLAGLGDISFLGWMSFVLLGIVVITVAWGKRGIVVFLPLIVLAVVMRPLPDFIDERIQVVLRSAEIMCASFGLDLLQVMHFRNSDTIQLVLMDFSADLACSKVFMLYPALWLIVVRGLIARYTWIRHAVQITQTTFWVVVLNAIHIIAVLMIEQTGTASIASGTGHYVALAVLLASIIGFSLSTDSMLSAIVPNPNMVDEIEELERAQVAAGVKWGNVIDQLVAGLTSVSVSFFRWSTVVLGFALVLFVSVRIYSAPKNGGEFFDPSTIAPISLPREALPDEIKGWRLAAFDEKQATNAEEESSERIVAWGYKKDSREVAFSVTGPFADYSDPSLKYLSAGWKLSVETDFSPIRTLLDGRKDSSRNVAVFRMTKDSGERGLVVCSCIDKTGKVVPPRLSLTKNYREYAMEKFYASALYAFGLRATPNSRALLFEPPVYSIQFSHEVNDRLKIKDDEVFEIFEVCRSAIQANTAFSNSN